MDDLEKKEEAKYAPRGSLALALIFLAFFVMMWIVNYRLLSSTWAVR